MPPQFVCPVRGCSPRDVQSRQIAGNAIGNAINTRLCRTYLGRDGIGRIAVTAAVGSERQFPICPGHVTRAFINALADGKMSFNQIVSEQGETQG